MAVNLSAYPSGSDVWEALSGMQIPSSAMPSSFDCDLAALAASQEWERLTRWGGQFLSSGKTQTHSFNPAGPRPPSSGIQVLEGGGKMVELDCGLLTSAQDASLPAAVVQVSGATFTQADLNQPAQGGEYWLEPKNAPLSIPVVPYQYIRLWVPVIALPGGLQVTGVWGFCLTLPPDVWMVVRNYAIASLIPQMSPAVTEGKIRVTEGEVTRQFDNAGAFSSEADRMRSVFHNAVNVYRRVRFGLNA